MQKEGWQNKYELKVKGKQVVQSEPKPCPRNQTKTTKITIDIIQRVHTVNRISSFFQRGDRLMVGDNNTETNTKQAT